jgi:hypothetical protein
MQKMKEQMMSQNGRPLRRSLHRGAAQTKTPPLPS